MVESVILLEARVYKKKFLSLTCANISDHLDQMKEIV